ncbi:MAG: hypothetical protein H6733_17460 [Alphaproteobacteria bacterium]|nr:hypothetical protein [Alphaproteobacteria bacterium]
MDASDAPAPRPSPDRWLTALGALIAVAVAGVLRWPGLARAYTSDEVGTMIPGGFWAQLADPETGVNPPLWRWLTTARLPAAEALAQGRELSLVLQLGAVGLGVAVGRLVGGRWWTGWLVGLLLAVHPWSVWEAPTARVYGLLTFVMQAHLLAVALWLDHPTRARAVAVAATAAVVPWTHYAALPWLAMVGLGVTVCVPGRRRLLALYVPSVVAALPLVSHVLHDAGRRVPPQRTVGEVVDLVASMDLATRALPHLRAGVTSVPDNPSLPVVVLAACLLGVVAAARRVPGVLWLAWWSALAVPIGVAIIAPHQLVRPTTTMLMAVAAAPLLFGAPARLPTGWARALGALLVTGVLAWGAALRWDTFEASDATGRTVRAVAEAIHDDAFPPGPFLLTPRGEALTLYFYLTGRYARNAPRGEGCRDCFVVRGRTFLPRDAADATTAPFVLSVDPRGTPPVGCLPLDAPPGARLWACPPPEPAPADEQTIR